MDKEVGTARSAVYRTWSTGTLTVQTRMVRAEDHVDSVIPLCPREEQDVPSNIQSQGPCLTSALGLICTATAEKEKSLRKGYG